MTMFQKLSIRIKILKAVFSGACADYCQKPYILFQPGIEYQERNKGYTVPIQFCKVCSLRHWQDSFDKVKLSIFWDHTGKSIAVILIQELAHQRITLHVTQITVILTLSNQVEIWYVAFYA